MGVDQRVHPHRLQGLANADTVIELRNLGRDTTTERNRRTLARTKGGATR
jgi:hypothetical protein